MDLRQDALQAAAHMALEVTHLVEQAGRPAVVTMGKWEVKPGAINVVPGEVSFSVDLRHPEEETLQQLSAAIRTQCESIAQARHLSISMELTGRSLLRKWTLDCKQRWSKQPEPVEQPGNRYQAAPGTIVRSWRATYQLPCSSSPA